MWEEGKARQGKRRVSVATRTRGTGYGRKGVGCKKGMVGQQVRVGNGESE